MSGKEPDSSQKNQPGRRDSISIKPPPSRGRVQELRESESRPASREQGSRLQTPSAEVRTRSRGQSISSTTVPLKAPGTAESESDKISVTVSSENDREDVALPIPQITQRFIKKSPSIMSHRPSVVMQNMPFSRKDAGNAATRLLSEQFGRSLEEHRWDLVRNHVHSGVYKKRKGGPVKVKPQQATTETDTTLTKTPVQESTGISTIRHLWSQVHSSCRIDTNSSRYKDSTVAFLHNAVTQASSTSYGQTWEKVRRTSLVMAQLAEPNDLQLSPVPPKGDPPPLSQRTPSRLHFAFGPTLIRNTNESQPSSLFGGVMKRVNDQPRLTSEKENVFRKATKQVKLNDLKYSKADLFVDGLSLDAVPNWNPFKILPEIAQTLHTPNIETNQLDFFTKQVYYNRAWKLLVLGLVQAEPLHRYIALGAIEKALPKLSETLVDQLTQTTLVEKLLSITVGDERLENRSRAAQLLGHVVSKLGKFPETSRLFDRTFKDLLKQLFEIQIAEKTGDDSAAMKSVKVHLIHAVGKLLKAAQSSAQDYESLVLYLCFEEMTLASQRILQYEKPLSAKIQKGGHETDPAHKDVQVMCAILDLLNDQFVETVQNRKYVGATFKSLVQPLMKSRHAILQKKAIQFISQWLPIANEDALLKGLDVVIGGLQETKSLSLNNFREPLYNQRLQELELMRYNEQCEVSLRMKLSRDVVQTPGTLAKLLPVPECPGFFCDPNSTMFNTKSILVDLPIHAFSNVTLRRPIPNIPGVPKSVTTVPPLFVELHVAESLPQPKSQYEFNERTGRVPFLPFGYTFSPTPSIDVGEGGVRSAITTPGVNSVEDTSGVKFNIMKNKSIWSTSDDIPKGYSKAPHKSDADLIDGRKLPFGFNTVCPYPGFDMDKIDRDSYPISPIYKRPVFFLREGLRSDNSRRPQTVDFDNYESSPELQDGYTFDRFPMLWPPKDSRYLKSHSTFNDFPLGAPVVLDIIQPNSPQLQRILARVTSINQTLSPIAVQRGANESGSLFVGAKFNLYVRPRSEDTWIAVQVEVVDEEYDDEMNFETSRGVKSETSSAIVTWSQNATSRAPSAHFHDSEVPFPPPSGFTSTNEPYFAPPSNFPSLPIGYTIEGAPYYGRNASIKPHPSGLTNTGTRFYPAESRLGASESHSRNLLAGIDLHGHPFYIPRGLMVPPPSGFTVDGVPFYDLLSLLRHHGMMVLPSKFSVVNMEETDQESWEDFLYAIYHDPKLKGSPQQRRRYEASFLAKLCTSLAESQPEVKHTLAQAHGRNVDPTQLRLDKRLKRYAIIPKQITSSTLQDPDDIPEFLRKGIQFSHVKKSSMRIVVEPSQLDFQSVRTPLVKNVAIKYRASRGDHGERDFYVSVEPKGIFELSGSHFRLQGEGVVEVAVTFNPTNMTSSKVHGVINLIDEHGKRLAASRITARNENFFRVHTAALDFGWALPHQQQRELSVLVQNLSESHITLTVSMQSDNQGSEHDYRHLAASKDQLSTKSSSQFSLLSGTVKLTPLETKNFTVLYKPTKTGRSQEVLKISGPGGEIISVSLVGYGGSPVVVFPENDDQTSLGSTYLTKCRTEQLQHILTYGTVFNGDRVESSLAEKISVAQNGSIEVDSVIQDFGICYTDSKSFVRMITFLNLSESSMTLSLYSHHPFVSCMKIVRIPPKMANAVEITLSGTSEQLKGNIDTTLEVSCPNYKNIPIRITAFVGQPIYFPVWELAFFKVARLGQDQPLGLSLVNESQYDLKVCLDGLALPKNLQTTSYISCSISNDELAATDVPAFSTIPVQFVFHAKARGPIVKTTILRIVKPFRKLVNSAMYSKALRFVGICIEPHPRPQEDIQFDPNNIEFLLKWLSHQKLVVEDYPDEQRHVLLDSTPNLNASSRRMLKSTPPIGPYAVVFQTDPYVSEVQPLSVEDPLSMADFTSQTSSSQILAIQNQDDLEHQVRLFASTYFILDPRTKQLRPREISKIDNYFNVPPDMPRLAAIYGFAVALDDFDQNFSSIQLIRRHAGVLLLPAMSADRQSVLDFGKIELSDGIMNESLRYLILCNPHSTPYSWNFKFLFSKSKLNPFNAAARTGELAPFETRAIPFTFSCDVSGLYEALCEISVTDELEKDARPIRMGTITFRGTAVSTHVVGVPEFLNFGSIFVSTIKGKSFKLVNDGSSELVVTTTTKSPFSVEPKSFTVPSKSTQDIEVYFEPAEPKPFSSQLLIFANQKQFTVPLSGIGGNAELVCEKYAELPLNFGPQKEDTIAWCSIYLTNRGTLPLSLKRITGDVPGLIKVQYMEIVPSSTISTSGREKFVVKNDYWSFVKRKLRLFDIFKRLPRDGKVMIPGRTPPNKSRKHVKEDMCIYLPVERNISEETSDDFPSIPSLKPFHSYHVNIGYVAKYSSIRDCDLYFHYVPELPEEDFPVGVLETSEMSLSVIGTVYRCLEISPPFLNFGNVPAERFLKRGSIQAQDSGFFDRDREVFEIPEAKDGVLFLDVVNGSRSTQALAVVECPPEFTVLEKNWIVEPGQMFSIPVEFHPPKEQIQYYGQIVLKHNYGITSISVLGVGASADLVTSPSVNFGNLKLGSSGIRKLAIHNRGLLPTPIELEIIQEGTDFKFLEDDPQEFEGFIGPGESKVLDVKCDCYNIAGSRAEVMMRWKRIPRSPYEKIHIPLRVQIGYPAFRMQNIELDFKTVYMDVNKTLEFKLYNDGNAACVWRADWNESEMTIEPSSGTIAPFEFITAQFTYTPTKFETLSCPVQFFTDSGVSTLMCSGVVGVPYLKLSAKDADFGIVTVEHAHSQSIDLKNTGINPIEYELVMLETSKNGIEASVDDPDTFYAEPTHGVIEPGASKKVIIAIKPKDYGVVYSASYVLRTKDGEQYKGQLTAQGGKAIIKIKPPVVQTGDSRPVLKPEETSKGNRFFKEPKMPLNPQDTNRLFLQSHIDNLYEVLAGLRAAESDMMAEDEMVMEMAQATGGKKGFGKIRTRRGSASSSRASIAVSSGLTSSRGSILAGGLTSKRKDAIAMYRKSGDDGMESGRLSRVEGSIGNLPIPEGGLERPSFISLDGSHVKPMSRGANEYLQLSPAPLPDPEKESKAAKFTDELSQLERELEMAIGLRDPGASIIGVSAALSSAEEQHSESNTKPISPSKKQSGGIGKYQPGRRRGLRLPRRTGSEVSFFESGIKPQEPLNSTRPGTTGVPDGSPDNGSRQSTPGMSGSSKSIMSPKEELIARSLTSQGFAQSPPSSQAVISTMSEVQSHKSQIQNIISSAQEIALSRTASLDSHGQKELMDLMNDRVMENTRHIMKAVKDQLTKDRWIPNREFLEQAIRKLQQTAVAFEEARKPRIEEEPLEENTFNLGLIRGGDKSEAVLLFSIPNEGNIPFEYQIVPNVKKSVYPPSASQPSVSQNPTFQIDPSIGTLVPGDVVNISSSFQAIVPGLYKQGFTVTSNDEDILAFTVVAKVGIPNLVVEPLILDFGLIEKGNAARKSFRITNTGGYKDMWRIQQELISNKGTGEEDASANPFKLSIDTAETQPGEHTDVVVTFSPREDGEYASRVKLMWTREPLLVRVTGVGGGAKLDFLFEDPGDKTFNGLDFGVCPVGMTFVKKLQVKNTGTVNASMKLSHSNPAVLLAYDIGEDGSVILLPGRTLALQVTLTPEKTETIREPIFFDLGASGSQNLNLKARCGTQQWNPSGKLEFPNVPIDESASSIVTVANNGTLDIPLQLSIEPPELKNIIKFAPSNNRDWTNGRPIRAGQELHVEVTAKSGIPRVIEGKLLARTKLCQESAVHEFPFKFRIFVEEIAVDDTADIAVGRIMIGESAKASRTITNFGNNKIQFRARIEKLNNNSDTSPWSVVSNKEGILDSNQSISIEAVFESIAGKGDDWQEAKLVVERLRLTPEGNEEWVAFSSLKLVGAGGHPELHIVPEQIDFGLIGVGGSGTTTFQFRNDGNAMLNYEIDAWDSMEEFKLADPACMKGSVPPGEIKPIDIMFVPPSEGSYSTSITVQTLIGERVFKLFGEGVSYRLDKDYLPDDISFGKVKLGETKRLEIALRNGCYHEVQVESNVYKVNAENQVDPLLTKADYLSIVPSKTRLKSKALDNEEPIIAHIEAMVPLEMNYSVHPSGTGLVDSEFVKSFPIGVKMLATARLEVLQGAVEHIPVDLEFIVCPLALLENAVVDDAYEAGDVLHAIDFGTTSLDSGAKQTTYLYNPNAFAVYMKCEVTNVEYFDVINAKGLIPPLSSKEITFQLKPMNIPDDAVDVPKVIECVGQLSLVPHIESLPEMVIPLTGTLLDQPPELEIPQMLDFGNVFQQKSSRMEFSFINPSRRPLKWEVSVDSAFEDIFKLVSRPEGTTNPKQIITVVLEFFPKIAVGYESMAFLTTEAGSFTIKLIGLGVQPVIDLDCPTTHFGVVGMAAPEFREVVVTNPTILPMRIRVRSDNASFLCDYSEIELKPGQSRTVKVFYNPQFKSRQEKAKISFYNLEDISGGLDPENLDTSEEIEAILHVGKAGFTDGKGKPTSPRKELEKLKEVLFDGVGGELKMIVEGKDASHSKTTIPMTLDPSRPATATLDATPTLEFINIAVSKMNRHQKVKRSFEIFNAGDTILELGIFDWMGVTPFNEEVAPEWMSEKNLIKYKVSPSNMVLHPHGKEKVTVVVEGIDAGDDSFAFMVRTKNHLNPRAIRVQFNGKVLSASADEALQAFVRADSSIETILNYALQEEELYASEKDIWKVLLPIVRIAPGLPSSELQMVPMVSPNVTRPDIGPYLVRPPAIPAVLPLKAKKWYMNRVSMPLENNRTTDGDVTDVMIRRQEALHFVQPLEKKVYLEKKRDI